MFRLIDKYRKNSSALFLTVYFAFLLISTIHHHHYDLNAENCFTSEGQENSALAMDFLSNGVTICAVNHFSHSIYNLNYSSSDLFLFLPKIDEKISLKDISARSLDVIYLTSPRAPPLFS